MRPFSFIAALLAGASLTGCAQIAEICSHFDTTPAAEQVVQQDVVEPIRLIASSTPTTWTPRVGWIGASRGGAAIRAEGYEHVVALDGASVNQRSSEIAAAGFDVADILARLEAIDHEAASNKPINLIPWNEPSP